MRSRASSFVLVRAQEKKKWFGQCEEGELAKQQVLGMIKVFPNNKALSGLVLEAMELPLESRACRKTLVFNRIHSNGAFTGLPWRVDNLK